MQSQVHVWECQPGLFEVSAHGTFGGGYSGLRTTREKVVDLCRHEMARYGTTKEGVEFVGPKWIRDELSLTV